MGDTQLFKGWVTHVIDPSSFWMQIGTDNDFDLFRVYQASINDYFNTNGDDLVVAANALSQGDCVAVINHSDHEEFKWRRARVSRIEAESVDVFYVDYGYSEVLRIGDVRSINGPFFDYLPPQAILVGLAGIQPLTRSWTRRAISVFEERVLHKSVLVSVLEMDQSQSLFVALYRRGDGGDWYSVTHGMLEEDLGLPNDYSFGFEKQLTHDHVDRALLLMNQMESGETSEEAQEEDEVQESEVYTYDGEDCQAAREVWNEQTETNEASKEIWDVLKEENQSTIEVWDDAIEELEGSSSEDETVEAKSNGEESSGAYGAQCIAKLSLAEVKSEQNKHLESSNLMAGANAVALSQDPMNSAGVPQFNIEPLSQTRSLSANEMQVKVGEQTQKRTVRALQKDLHRCEDDLNEGFVPATNVLWGRSDSQVGEPHYADDNDLQESISEELYNRFPGEVDDMRLFKHSWSHETQGLKKCAMTAESAVPDVVLSKEIPALQHNTVMTGNRQPLTEEESYHLEVQIVEVLMNKKNETPEMLKVQVHDLVPTAETLPPDLLSAVITSILESIICHKCSDPAVALTILETYTGVNAFQTVLIDTLKALKDRFVKLPKVMRRFNHEDFASLLAMLCIQSQCWSPSICDAIQKYSMGTVEKWIIFNKKRQQDLEAAISTELIYLDCVHVFMRQASAILTDQFPQHIHFWLEEIKEKLLHDLTQRSVRARLLDILLDNMGNNSGFSHIPRASFSTVSTGTQTGPSSGRGTPDCVQRAVQIPLYKAPRGPLYPRNDPYTPHLFPSEIQAKPESPTQNNSGNFDSTFHSMTEYQMHESSQSSCVAGAVVGEEDLSFHNPEADLNICQQPKNTATVESDHDLRHHDQEAESNDCQQTEMSGECTESASFDNFKTVNGVHNGQKSDEECTETVIRYTPLDLRAMNPMNGIPRSSADLKEPFELRHVFSRMDDDARFSEKENSLNNSHIAHHRYMLSDSLLEGPVLPGSNVDRCATLQAYLSHPLNPVDKKYVNNNNLSSDFDYSPTAISYSEKSTSSLAQNLTNNEPLVQGEDCMHGGDLDCVESSTDYIDQTHETPVPSNLEIRERPVDLFTSTKLKSYPEEQAVTRDCENERCPQTASTAAGKKKKKTKFRPLQDFTEENRTIGVDESGTGFDELDEFSEEALQMYIQLEKDGEERQLAEARMIHAPKPFVSTSSRTRESLFADVRKSKSASTSTPWVPKKRKCTRCGSDNHIISECSEGTINNIDDMSYMF